MLYRKERSRAPHARLDLVGNKQNAVFVAELTKLRKKQGSRDPMAAFTLDGLNDHRRYFRGIHQARKQVATPRFDAVHPAGGRVEVVCTIAAIAVRHVDDAGQMRAETSSLNDLAGGYAHRPVRPAMKRPVERNDVRSFRMKAGKLQRCFHRFSARVAQVYTPGLCAGRNGRQAAAQRRIGCIVEVRAADMQQLGGLLLDGLHHLGMAVPRKGDRDAGHEVQKAVSVNVLYLHACSAAYDERVFLDERG